MCSACATIRPRASKSAAEQSRRSLMFEENALRTSTVPISSAIPERAALVTERVTGSTPLQDEGSARRRARPPSRGGRGRSSRAARRSRGLRRRPGRARDVAVAQVAAAAWHLRCRHCKEARRASVATSRRVTTSRLGVEPEPVPPLVRGVEVRRPRRSSARATGRGSARRRSRSSRAGKVRAPRAPPSPRTSRRRSRAAGRRPRARARSARPRRTARARARSRAPPRARRRAAARRRRRRRASAPRVDPALDATTTRSARAMFAFTTSMHAAAGSRSPERPLGQPLGRGRPRRRGRRRPRGGRARGSRRSPSAPCRRGRSTPAPARAPAERGPTRSAPPSSSQAIEPPPAPIVCTSTIGNRIGTPATTESAVTWPRRRDARDVGARAAHVEREHVARRPRRTPHRRRPPPVPRARTPQPAPPLCPRRRRRRTTA